MAAKPRNIDDADLITITTQYRREAADAKVSRMKRNERNFDCYHMRGSSGEKLEGQSDEFLPKMSMAVEQNSVFIQQGLVDIGDWFNVEAQEGIVEDVMKIKPSEVYKLANNSLKQIGIVRTMANAMKLGMIGSLMIAKVTGEWIPKPKFEAKKSIDSKGNYTMKLLRKDEKAWRLKINLVRHEDYFPDPTDEGLYVLEDIYMDYYKVQALAEQGVYDKKVVKELMGTGNNSGWDQQYKRDRETDQNSAGKGYRNVIKLTECWGSIVNSDGEVVAENVMWTIANDKWVIQRPIANPLWHGENPYVVQAILDVPGSVWGKALMDAPAMMNFAINEMFNLILDGGMMSVHGIKQIREHWLEDPEQVQDGVRAGQTLRANTACPPGQAVIERVDTSTIPSEGINVFNLLQQEFNTSAMTNDLRLGAVPFRQVKATEVVESSQTITSMFAGIAKHIEEGFVTPLLEKCWKTQAQHMQEIDVNSLKSILGSARAEELQQLTNEELFAETVQGCKFQVFGISAILSKQKDFSKLQGLLQTIASSPVLMEAFAKQYDMTKLLKEIMTSLDIRDYKLKSDDANLAPMPGPAPQEAGPDMQSQIPQAGAAGNQGDLTMEGQTQAMANSAIQGNTFPGSRASRVAPVGLG